MKKSLLSILLVIMATLAILTLCACGKDKEDKDEKETVCIHDWKFLNGTYPACKEGGFSIYQCDICKEKKTVDAVECKYEYNFVLNGRKCTDGFSIKATCIYCGEENVEDELNGTAYTDHTIFKTLPAEYTYKMCQGVAKVYKCPCGEVCDVSRPEMCENSGWIENSKKIEVDEETGIAHEIKHSFCTRCKFEIITDTYKETFGCYTYTREGGKIVDEDVVLCEYFDEVVNEVQDHNIKASYDNLLGKSCEDGYVYTEECTKCEYFKQYHKKTHDIIFLKETIDLSEYGVCGGKLEIYECACGEVKSSKTGFIVECKESKLENKVETIEGTEIKTISITCEECNVVLVKTEKTLQTSGIVKFKVIVKKVNQETGEAIEEEVYSYGYDYEK